MAKDLDIRIEEAHERVLRRIGDVFGQRTITGAVCPVNKFDARNVKNYKFIVKCSCGNIEHINPYHLARMEGTTNCIKCKPID